MSCPKVVPNDFQRVDFRKIVEELVKGELIRTKREGVVEYQCNFPVGDLM